MIWVWVCLVTFEPIPAFSSCLLVWHRATCKMMLPAVQKCTLCCTARPWCSRSDNCWSDQRQIDWGLHQTVASRSVFQGNELAVHHIGDPNNRASGLISHTSKLMMVSKEQVLGNFAQISNSSGFEDFPPVDHWSSRQTKHKTKR